MDSRQRDKVLSDDMFEAEKASYDAEAKNLLANRHVLAPVCQRTVAELRDVSLEDIAEKCIEGDPLVGEVPIEAGLTNEYWPTEPVHEKIRGLQTESVEHKEGKITFDVLFYVRVPKTGKRIKLLVNIEAQRLLKSYPMSKRAMYYMSRLISSQKGREFTHDHYEGICKVYTIWICFYLPKGHKSTIAHYRTEETLEYGDYHEARENYDLFDVTMIYVGKEETQHWLLDFLYTMFLERITGAQKAEKLQEKFGFHADDELRKGMDRMCNLSDGLVKEAWRKSQEAEKENTMRQLQKKGMTLSFIADVVGWTVEQVRAFIVSQGLTPIEG